MSSRIARKQDFDRKFELAQRHTRCVERNKRHRQTFGSVKPLLRSNKPLLKAALRGVLIRPNGSAVFYTPSNPFPRRLSQRP